MKSSIQRESALLQAAHHLDEAERRLFLEAACGGDIQLKAKLEALLIARSSEASVGSATMGDPPQGQGKDEEEGQLIGPYKLREKVGEGGWGIVYVAEQEVPVRRRVALKILKMGMDTKQVIARFEAERQPLAMMDHPHIAKVFDAGATGKGRPFFVMELVRGVRITEYCDTHQLAIPERLGLFIQVCNAIQHAHQKGIIHRDIKPSNVLVSVNDGVPIAKVIDFGIAKAAQGRLSNLTVYTELNQFIGTPAYMSPEQAEMSSLDIDTRSDVYSLGVLLYELLTGKPPFETAELMAAGLDAMRRAIREKDPMRPSTRLAAMGLEDQTSTARRRRQDAPRLIHFLEGDLDWIVMKCLEKDRTRRYHTVNGLALDLQRHLAHEVVTARPPSAGYRIGKFLRRNLLASTFTALVAVVVIASAIVAIRLAWKARKAEAAAVVESEKNSELAGFFAEMLEGVSPAVAAGRDTRLLREILERSVAGLDTGLKRQPKTEVELRCTIADVYGSLSLPKERAALARRALQLALDRVPDDRQLVAKALLSVAKAERELNNRDEAASLLTRAERLVDETHPMFAGIRIEMAEIHQQNGNLKAAEESARDALRILGDLNAPAKTIAYNGITLARILRRNGDLQGAYSQLRDALAFAEKAGSSDVMVKAIALQDLATVTKEMDDWHQAGTLYREAREIFIRLTGLSSLATAYVSSDWAHIVAAQGNYPESNALYEDSLRILRQTFGPEHPGTTFAEECLADTYRVQKDWRRLMDALTDRLAWLNKDNQSESQQKEAIRIDLELAKASALLGSTSTNNALNLIGALQKSQATSSLVWMKTGVWLGVHELWSQSAHAFEMAIRTDPSSHIRAWDRLILASILSDSAGANALIERRIQEVISRGQAVSSQTAMILMFKSAPESEINQLATLAQKTPSSEAEMSLVGALKEYRLGRYMPALQALGKIGSVPPHITPSAWDTRLTGAVIRSLCHFQMKEHHEARQHAEYARKLYESIHWTHGKREMGNSVEKLWRGLVFLLEAETLLNRQDRR